MCQNSKLLLVPSSPLFFYILEQPNLNELNYCYLVRYVSYGVSFASLFSVVMVSGKNQREACWNNGEINGEGQTEGEKSVSGLDNKGKVRKRRGKFGKK